MLTMSHQIRLTMTCKVCRQTIDGDRQHDTSIAVALFGAVAFSVCPSCGQQPENQHDTNYRQRARRFIAARRRDP